MKKTFFLLSLLLFPLLAKSVDVEIDGIKYNINTETQTTEVIKNDNKYSGDIVIPSKIEYQGISFAVTRIGSDAFSGCIGLTTIIIPNSVTEIGSAAFYNCTGLTSVTIPNSVTTIREIAFENCTSLTSVNITDIEAWCNIIFSLPSSNPLGCAHHLYLNGLEINNLTIPDSVTSIGNFAFYGCTGLTTVSIGKSVTRIGNYIFYGCSNLTSIVVDEENPIYDSRNNCNAIIKTTSNALIYGCKATVIPNSIISIEGFAFYGCKNLVSITIPNSITNIGNLAFSDCTSLTSIVVDEDNPIFDSRDNCNAIIETLSNTLLLGCKATVIPHSVTSIGYGAFYNCTGLTSVNIPKSVTRIGNEAFSGCIGLTSIIIPNSVTEIGYSAFSNCTGLTSVTIPNSVTEINTCTFYGCTGLTSVTIPNSVTTIRGDAFRGCIGLTSITIPNSVTDLSGFSDCTGLTSVTIPNSVTRISGYAFSNCTGLTSINIPNSVTLIENGFHECTNLTSVNITDLEAWCRITFEHQSSNPLYYAHHLYLNGTEIKELVIPNGVTVIDRYAFICCSGLLSVTIPNSVTRISGYAFSYCSGLTSVNIPNSVTTIDWYAFAYCTGLTSINIPNSVTYIDWHAFAGCKDLTTLFIGSGIQTISAGAFYNDEELTDLYCYAEKVPSTSHDVFYESYIEKATLHVPAGSVEEYKASTPWSGFGNIVALTDAELGIKEIPSHFATQHYFDLTGKKLEAPSEGITIVVTEFEDGRQVVTKRLIK